MGEAVAKRSGSHFFLDAFARAYAVGVARAPDRRSMRDLHALQCGVFEEQRLHESVAAESGIDLGTVRPGPTSARSMGPCELGCDWRRGPRRRP